MTTVNERRYLEWYAANLYSGAGAAVELGCWLGSLTRAVCRGLQQNRALREIGESGAGLEVFDRFEWDSTMESWVAGTSLAGRTPEGGDYEAVFREQVGEYLPMLRIHRADLANERWTGGPIELLVVDAMKTMPTARGICRNFYPALLPERGYLIHQDFLHFFHGWIHVTTYVLRDFFEWTYEVPDSDMVVFRCVRRPPEYQFPEDLSGFSDSEITAAFDWVEEHVSPAKRHTIAAARAMSYIHRGKDEIGKRMVREALNGRYAGSASFQALKAFTGRFGIVNWD